jgi:hypothetical protein
MPFCPQCGYEYRDGFSVCSDCGIELVEQKPEPKLKHHNERSVVVFKAIDDVQAMTMKAVLESAGIPVAEIADRSGVMDGLNVALSDEIYSRLVTIESRAEEATKLIQEYLDAYQRGDLALVPDSERTEERDEN